MPRLDYKTCANCERHTDECGVLSHQRLCGDCAELRLVENIYGLRFKVGVPLDRWRRGMISCAGGILPERLDTTTERR